MSENLVVVERVVFSKIGFIYDTKNKININKKRIGYKVKSKCEKITYPFIY